MKVDSDNDMPNDALHKQPGTRLNAVGCQHAPEPASGVLSFLTVGISELLTIC